MTQEPLRTLAAARARVAELDRELLNAIATTAAGVSSATSTTARSSG